MSKKKVLFISHDATRTGAPIIFLNFLRWFRDNANIPYRITLRDGGELKPEFQTLAPVSVFNKIKICSKRLEGTTFLLPHLQSAVCRIFHNQLKKQLIQDKIGLIYSNTITNGEVLELLSCLNCPVITHVHELEYWIYRYGSKNLNHVKKYTTHYIAASEAVKKNLIQNHEIPEKKIDVVYGFIPINDQTLFQKDKVRRQTLKELNIPQDALVVGGCGTTDWRKGPDLFVQLARTICHHQTRNPVHFVWVGGHTQGLQFYEIMHDVKNLGLENHMQFIGVRQNPLDYFTAFDIFAMVSREDPFPLVNLEAASLGKPIICFENAGGSPEFVENDTGFVVPYLDLDAMADKVITLVKDEGLRNRLGARAAQKVQERHNISVAAPQILNIIETLLESPC